MRSPKMSPIEKGCTGPDENAGIQCFPPRFWLMVPSKLQVGLWHKWFRWRFLLWADAHSYESPSFASLNACVELKSEGRTSQTGGRVILCCEALSPLRDLYASDDLIYKINANMMFSTSLSRNQLPNMPRTPNRVPWCHGVYDKYIYETKYLMD